ncbi:MAG: WD40/YVTN/BNR-like repeat-containing protein [Candidatus Aminicenantia bacterium]
MFGSSRLLQGIVSSLFILVFVSIAYTANEVKIDSATFGDIKARSIGPATMSGRITDIDCVVSDPRIIYVGTASGGVWKSINGGTTFKAIFEKYTMSIGCVTIDQANPNTVWVGTGETNVRNSTSVGTGLYKTTDGGKTWECVGLKDSERISEVIVHPKNPNIVYVGALGHLWNSNEERGVYKTTDGGKTWERILYVDENTGCIDLVMDPQEPDVLYAAMWQFRRKPYFFTSGGPGSGFYKTTDGGKTWKKMTKGLPKGELGRIAVDIAPSRPSTLYAIVEAKETALYRSDDMGETWKKVSSTFGVKARPFYLANIKVDPKDHNRLYNPSMILFVSENGGKSFSNPFAAGFSGFSPGVHPDHQALWINPNDPNHILLGTDGGVYVSYDRASHFKFLSNLPVSQFYHVSYDMKIPYNVYGGLQDNGSWHGPSRSFNWRGIQNKDWQNVGGGDGFYVFVDPTDPDIIYNEWQGGRIQRYNKRTGEMKDIRPFPKKNEPKYRFNWNTAIAISPNDPKVIYIGAQFLFRSRDRGDNWERISPDLTTNDPEKQRQAESGGLTIDNTTAENHCTIVTISESPLDVNVIWVGTDDGNLQVTRDGGKNWTNVVGNIPGLPPNTWCPTVEASHHDGGTAYVAFDGHRAGDMTPYVYKTTDFGETWTSLVTETIEGYCHVIREDLVNPNLLFLGTEFGLFVSVDGGKQWAHFKESLPRVGIRDIAIHPREHDLILATHGLGIQIIDDITPLRHLTPEVLNSEAAILPSRPATITIPAYLQEFPGDGEFTGKNPPEGAVITYYLKRRHIFGDLKFEIFDTEGKLIRSLPTGKRRGINRIHWNMRLKAPKTAAAPSLAPRILVGPMVPEGTYTVKLTKGEKPFFGDIKLIPDPSAKHSAEDRALRHNTVMKLYHMQERLAYIADAIADARDKTNERVEELKKAKRRDKGLINQLKAFAEKLDKLHKTLVQTGGLFGESKLREEVIDLYASVSGYGGRPTESQLAYLSVLEERIKEAEKNFKSITGKRLLSLNAKLLKKKLAPIQVMTEEEYKKKEEEK